MLIGGVTGGIGSGKSIVCEIFRQLGIPVYNADERAKYLIHYNTELKKALQNTFGNHIYQSNGALDKSKLASIIFNDKQALETINALVHPLVGNDFKQWMKQFCSQKKMVIKEAAILFESNTYRSLDFIITVIAPRELRIQRVISRDRTSREKVEKRMNNQWSDEKKTEMSDFVIINDEKQAVIPQVLNIYQQLTQHNQAQ